MTTAPVMKCTSIVKTGVGLYGEMYDRIGTHWVVVIGDRDVGLNRKKRFFPQNKLHCRVNSHLRNLTKTNLSNGRQNNLKIYI